jgi:hypothetical protein
VQITAKEAINGIALEPFTPFGDITNLHPENPLRQVDAIDRNSAVPV